MMAINISDEFFVILLSVVCFLNSLFLIVVIKLLKDMRESGWNIEYSCMMACKAADSCASKAGYIERRVITSMFTGTFSS